MAAIKDGVELVLESLADLIGIGQRQLVARQQQRRAHQRLTELGQQHPRYRVVRHPDTDGAALGMLQPPRRLARGRQQKRERSGRGGLEQPELPGLDARVAPDLAQVAAYQREMMVPIGAANASQTLER